MWFDHNTLVVTTRALAELRSVPQRACSDWQWIFLPKLLAVTESGSSCPWSFIPVRVIADCPAKQTFIVPRWTPPSVRSKPAGVCEPASGVQRLIPAHGPSVHQRLGPSVHSRCRPTSCRCSARPPPIARAWRGGDTARKASRQRAAAAGFWPTWALSPACPATLGGSGRGGAGRGGVGWRRSGADESLADRSARPAGRKLVPRGRRHSGQPPRHPAASAAGAARRPPQVEPLRVGGAGGGTGHCRGLRSRRHRLSGEGKHTRGALSRRNGRGDPCTAVPPVPSAPSPLGAGRREPDQSRHRSGAARRAAAQHTGSTRDPAGGFADRVIIHGRESMALNHDSHLTTIRATPSYRVARGCRSAIPRDPAESVLTVTLLSDSEPRVVRRRLRAEPPGSGRRPSPALHAASGGSQPRVAPATDDGGRLATEADGG